MELRRILFILVVTIVVVSLVLGSVSLLSFFIPKANVWALQVTQIGRLQQLGFDGSGVTIGIVDTGVDIDHHEFDASSFHAWNDSILGKPAYYDDSDHGTHVAGILVSKGSFQGLFSGVNMQGVAPGARIIVVKTLSNSDCVYGGGNDSAIAAGIQFCIDHGVDIICLSLGKNPGLLALNESSKTAQFCAQAIDQGIFVVAPAGNDRQSDDGDVVFLSSLSDVIAVGAVGKSGSIAAFSSQGHQYLDTQHPHKKPELVAPGVGLLSTRVNDAYGEISGTSQAAGYVAGIIALLLEAYPWYKHGGAHNQQAATIRLFKDIFARTAKKIGSLADESESYSHDDVYGYGLVQAFAAYEELAKL